MLYRLPVVEEAVLNVIVRIATASGAASHEIASVIRGDDDGGPLVCRALELRGYVWSPAPVSRGTKIEYRRSELYVETGVPLWPAVLCYLDADGNPVVFASGVHRAVLERLRWGRPDEGHVRIEIFEDYWITLPWPTLPSTSNG